MAKSLADSTAEVQAIEAEIAALEEELPAYDSAGRGKGTKRGRSATKMEANSRPIRARKPSAAVVEPSPGFNLLSVKDKKKDLADKIKQLERQIAKEAAETKLIKEVDSEERKMQMQIEALQKKLEETKQAKEKALKKAQKTVEVAKEPAPTPVKPAPVKSSRGSKTPATPVVPVSAVAVIQDEATRQYCYCKKLWDQSVPMIGCDACDEWYHLTCLNMLSSEAVCIESYVCVTCQQKKTKNKMKTQYKSDEAMAIEISQMPGELVTREIEVVKAELRELAGKDADAIIAAIESPPPLESAESEKPDVAPTATSSSSSSCSSSIPSSSSSATSSASSSLPPQTHTQAAPSASSSASVFVPETPVFNDGDAAPPPLEAPTATTATITADNVENTDTTNTIDNTGTSESAETVANTSNSDGADSAEHTEHKKPSERTEPAESMERTENIEHTDDLEPTGNIEHAEDINNIEAADSAETLNGSINDSIASPASDASTSDSSSSDNSPSSPLPTTETETPASTQTLSNGESMTESPTNPPIDSHMDMMPDFEVASGEAT